MLLMAIPYAHAFFQHTSKVVDNSFVSGTFVSPSVSPTVSVYAPHAGDIVINEINWGGSRLSTSDEWLELRNMRDIEIDIGGWTLENLGGSASASATITVPQGKVIPAKGYFLIANAATISSKINVTPDVITTAISLLDTGEEIRLRSISGVVIDIANRTGAWFRGSKTPVYKSMERKDPPANGADVVNWQDASTHTGMDASGSIDEYGTPSNPNGI